MFRFITAVGVLIVAFPLSAQTQEQPGGQVADGYTLIIYLKYANCRAVAPFVDAKFNGSPEAGKRPGGMRLERIRMLVNDASNGLMIWTASSEDYELARSIVDEIDKNIFGLHIIGGPGGFQ